MFRSSLRKLIMFAFAAAWVMVLILLKAFK
jgi:hypothetical protein